jgi:gluconokinase
MMGEIAVDILVVMGVSGCGKSTVSALLAGRLGWALVEGDDLHPPANIDKMARGIPLDDADREPWLAAIEQRIDCWRGAGTRGVLTCSALKRAYRDRLAAHRPALRFIYLKGSKELIASRLARRLGHFMPPALLDSQFAALEEPEADEPVLTIPIGPAPKQLVETVVGALQQTI